MKLSQALEALRFLEDGASNQIDEETQRTRTYHSQVQNAATLLRTDLVERLEGTKDESDA